MNAKKDQANFLYNTATDILRVRDEMPEGTDAAKARKARLTAQAAEMLKRSETLLEEQQSEHRMGVIKALHARAQDHIDFTLKSISDEHAEYRKHFATCGDLAYEMEWNADAAARAAARHIAFSNILTAITSDKNPDFGLVEAIAKIKDDIDSWSPCHSSCLFTRAVAEAKFEGLRWTLRQLNLALERHTFAESLLKEKVKEQMEKQLPVGTTQLIWPVDPPKA